MRSEHHSRTDCVAPVRNVRALARRYNKKDQPWFFMSWPGLSVSGHDAEETARFGVLKSIGGSGREGPPHRLLRGDALAGFSALLGHPGFHRLLQLLE
jgi:hypothetical protein